MQLGQTLTLCALLFNPPDPFFKGVVRACGLSVAVMAFPARQLRPGI